MIKIHDSHKLFDQTIVSLFKDRFGFGLPNHYLKFLRRNNGGYPEPEVFPFEMDGTQNLGVVHRFLSLSEREIDGLLYFMEIYKSRVPKYFIPIAFDPGGNLILLSHEQKTQGKIYFWDHENESEKSNSKDYKNTHLISNSLDEFLSIFRELES